jgi:hypothetical protein
MESTIESEAKTWSPVRCMEAARTGAPALARTALTPMERSRVLLPDIFEPLTM